MQLSAGCATKVDCIQKIGADSRPQKNPPKNGDLPRKVITRLMRKVPRSSASRAPTPQTKATYARRTAAAHPPPNSQTMKVGIAQENALRLKDEPRSDFHGRTIPLNNAGRMANRNGELTFNNLANYCCKINSTCAII